MSRNAFFSSRSEENIFFDVDIVVKKHKNVKIEIWVCTLIDNEYASLLFSQTFFSYSFCMLSDFANVFERKVWRVQVAHLHNAARALSSPSRCFQLSTNLGKDFFRYLWYCDKRKTKQIECGLAWHWLNSTDLGLIDMSLINLNAEIVACIYYHSENRATSQIWKILPNMVFPPFFFFFFWGGGGGGWRRSEHAHASYPGLFFRPSGFTAPIWGGKKGEFRDWTSKELERREIQNATVRE